MDYEVSMTNETRRSYPTPHAALAKLLEQLKAKIEADGKNPNHYITQTIVTLDAWKYRATYSEERKKRFENPL